MKIVWSVYSCSLCQESCYSNFFFFFFFFCILERLLELIFIGLLSKVKMKVQGINPKFPTYEKQKLEKTHAKKKKKKKKSHAQDNIYVVRQFAYVHRVARILLLSRKIKSATTVFTLTHKATITTTTKTLITKKRFLHPAHRIHIGLKNGPKNRGVHRSGRVEFRLNPEPT